MEFGWGVSRENYLAFEDYNLVLRAGIKLEDEEMMLYAIGKGADVNHLICNRDGKAYWAPIAFCAFTNFRRGAEILLERGARVNILEGVDVPLSIATVEGHVEIVRLLLKHGADVAMRTECGETALHSWAIESEENAEIAELLLEYGADIEALSDHNYTPLMTAAAYGNFFAFEWLLERGAKLDGIDVHEVMKKSALGDLVTVREGHEKIDGYLRKKKLKESSIYSRLRPSILDAAPPAGILAFVGKSLP